MRIVDVNLYNLIGQTIQGHYWRESYLGRWYDGLGTHIVGGQAATRTGKRSAK